MNWKNALGSSVSHLAEKYTLTGSHITLGSVLQATRDWHAALPSVVDFVDPEVGMIAQAAVRSGIRFGYLHTISDNVAEKYDEDLSNEKMRNVLLRSQSYMNLCKLC